MAHKVSCFISPAAETTEQQCRQTYVTLSTSSIFYNKLRKCCKRFVGDGDESIGPAASNMLKNLNAYLLETATDQAKSAGTLDLPFLHNVLHDADILRRYAVLPLNEVGAMECRQQKRFRMDLEELVDARSMDGPVDDRVVRTRGRDRVL